MEFGPERQPTDNFGGLKYGAFRRRMCGYVTGDSDQNAPPRLAVARPRNCCTPRSCAKTDYCGCLS
jgi:hypothetical protein